MKPLKRIKQSLWKEKAIQINKYRRNNCFFCGSIYDLISMEDNILSIKIENVEGAAVSLTGHKICKSCKERYNIQ